MVRIFSLAVLIILTSGCRHAEKEADRTKEQLSRLAHDVGADQMVDGVSRLYSENVAPAMSGAKSATDAAAKSVPVIQAAQDAGASASETLSSAGAVVVQKTTYVFRQMPDSEAELERMIDYYNNQFATWLKQNFISLDNEHFSARKSPSVKTRYQPRTRPHAK